VVDIFTVGKKLHLTKSGGLRSWKALNFKRRGLEPRSLTEVYAYVYHKGTQFCVLTVVTKG